MKEEQSYKVYFLFLMSLGVCAALLLGIISYPQREIGSADMAAYAEIARSITLGQPFQVGYVQHYFQKYETPFHPVDHYPPLKGVLIAPFFLILGVTPFAAILPSLMIGTLLFPPVVFGMCRRLNCAPPVCFVAGLATLGYPLIVNHAGESLADLDQAFFVACAIFSLLGRRTWKRPVLAGFWTALAFLAKTSGLFVIPGFSLFFLLDEKERFTNRLKYLAVFLLFVFLVSSPWLLRNQVIYGDPLFSMNKHVAAMTDYCGIFEMVGPAVAMYWGEKPPTLADVPSLYGYRRVAEVMWGRSLSVLKFLPFLGSVLLAPFFVRSRNVRLLCIVALSFSLFSVLTFAVHERYLLALFPVGICLTASLLNIAAKTLSAFLSRPSGEGGGGSPWQIHRPEQVTTTLMLLSLCLFIGYFAESAEIVLGKYLVNRSVPTSYAYKVSEWIDGHLPEDAVVMTLSALEIRFYSGRYTLSPTSSGPEAYKKILNHYRVEYFAIPAFNPNPVFSPLYSACLAFLESPHFQGQLMEENKFFRIWRLG